MALFVNKLIKKCITLKTQLLLFLYVFIYQGLYYGQLIRRLVQKISTNAKVVEENFLTSRIRNPWINIRNHFWSLVFEQSVVVDIPLIFPQILSQSYKRHLVWKKTITSEIFISVYIKLLSTIKEFKNNLVFLNTTFIL